MNLIIDKRAGELIINVKAPINKSLSNREVLEVAINNVSEETKHIVINSDYVRKEYDASLIKGLYKYNTKDPINEFLSGRKELCDTRLVIEAKKVMKKGMNSSDIYNKLFTPRITPQFIKSIIKLTPANHQLIDEYKVDDTMIRVLSKGNQLFYELNPPEMKIDYETIKKVSETLKELQGTDLELSELKREVNKIINSKNLDDTTKNIIKRHSTGFGLLDIIFKDENVQDIYIYSSGGTVQLNHAKHGECTTNLILSKRDIDGIGTKIRVVSGRPFDDSFPVIDFELSDYNLRVCGVREPLTFNGTGYAFRKHKTIPWTLPDFVENGMISLEVAGLLNFLVDGQCSILITGPRGSGKTSLLSALINEVPLNQRLIIIEDTPELPVSKLSDAGFKIQHLRIKPHLKRGTEYELSAEEALRTALRLGESVLVIGEVRGEEAKALFEAMRVGAAGNVVLGTIHGSTVYDTFDRIVNDLKVPATSFKATDIIISCANLRAGESIKSSRRVNSVTEVRKDWINQPLFNDLTVFKNRTLELSPRINESVTLKRISELKGMTVNESLASIKLRAKAKELLIKLCIPRNPRLIADYNSKVTELLSKDKKNFLGELRKFLDEERQNYKQGRLSKTDKVK
ncbi:MAG: type II/IV secretion system ATPase subunit [Candidatus Nanoarchaeia archaeon]|jgi:type IV secretory pathway ATPase VirB11/archaellum biosynthesis ATPase